MADRCRLFARPVQLSMLASIWIVVWFELVMLTLNARFTR
jgi:hypothetical protein